MVLFDFVTVDFLDLSVNCNKDYRIGILGLQPESQSAMIWPLFLEKKRDKCMPFLRTGRLEFDVNTKSFTMRFLWGFENIPRTIDILVQLKYRHRIVFEKRMTLSTSNMRINLESQQDAMFDNQRDPYGVTNNAYRDTRHSQPNQICVTQDRLGMSRKNKF